MRPDAPLKRTRYGMRFAAYASAVSLARTLDSIWRRVTFARCSH